MLEDIDLFKLCWWGINALLLALLEGSAETPDKDLC